MTARHDGDPLEDRAAIVTGAGHGLGLAIARRFAASGAKVLLVDRDPIVSTRVGEQDLPPKLTSALVKDLADPDAAPVVFRTAIESLGYVNVLVNNAAWSLHKPMGDMTIEEFDRLTSVNQRAPYFLAREFLQLVSSTSERPKDPAIINVASVNALAGNANLVAYAGTKGALVAMTRAMAVEMASVGIRVNSVSPGAVDTPTTQRVVAEGALDMQTFFESYLIRRFARCEEIAELVVYLSSPAAAYVTGANWVIDGGYMAR